MLIDWFTVIAQAVNFLILVWLMKKFLYGPVIEAIDKREQRIARQIRDAEEEKAKALQEREDFEAKNKDLESRRAAMIAAMEEEIAERRSKTVTEIREESESIRQRWRQSLEEEKEALAESFTSRAGQEALATARQIISDLSGATLHELVVAVFLDNLHKLDAVARGEIMSRISHNGDPVEVRSAMPLSEPDRQKILQALEDVFNEGLSVTFEVDESLVCGLEVRSGGRRIGWNVDDYLHSLRQRVDQWMAHETGSGNPDTK